MYVIAATRSNATEFCLNYSFENNKQYGGELSHPFCNVFIEQETFINIKQTNHETGIQPTFNPSSFISNWNSINDEGSIFLIRSSNNIPLLQNAMVLITRKNIREQIIAVVDYVLKVSKTIGKNDTGNILSADAAISHCSMFITDICILLQYAKNNNRTITWTEDFSTPTTTHSDFVAWPNATPFLFLLDRHLSKIDFSTLNSHIITTPNV